MSDQSLSGQYHGKAASNKELNRLFSRFSCRTPPDLYAAPERLNRCTTVAKRRRTRGELSLSRSFFFLFISPPARHPLMATCRVNGRMGEGGRAHTREPRTDRSPGLEWDFSRNHYYQRRDFAADTVNPCKVRDRCRYSVRLPACLSVHLWTQSPDMGFLTPLIYNVLIRYQ